MFDFEGQHANEIVNNFYKKLIKDGKDPNDFFDDKIKFTRAFIIALSSENTENLKALKLLNFERYAKNFIISEEIFNNIIKKENRIEYFSVINELGLFNNDYNKNNQDIFSYLIKNNKSELVDDLLEADVQPFFSGKNNYLLTMIKNKDIINFKKYMAKDFYVNMEDIKDIFMEVSVNSKEEVKILTEMVQLIANNSYFDKKEEMFLAGKLFTNMIISGMDLETLKLFDKQYPINEINIIQNYSYFKKNPNFFNSLLNNQCEILEFFKEIPSMSYILNILKNEMFFAAFNNDIQKNKYFVIGSEVELKDFINKKIHDLLPNLIQEDKLNSIDFLLNIYTHSKSEISTAPDFDIQSYYTEFSELINKNIDNIIEKIWLDKESKYYDILDKYILNAKNINKKINIINKMYVVKGNENKGIHHDIISLPLLAVYMNNNEMTKKIINHSSFDLSEQIIVLSLHRTNNEAVETVFNNFVLYDKNNKLNTEEMKNLLQEIKKIPERDLHIRYDYSVNYIQTLSEKRELHDLITPNIVSNKEKNRL